MNKSMLGLVLAVGLGLIAALGSYAVLTAGEHTYLVAAKDMPAGTKVDPNNLSTLTIHGDIPGAVSASDQEKVAGQTVVATIPKGGVVMEAALSAKGGSAIDQNLQNGAMAYTIQADNVTGISPNLHPGNFVYVFGSWTYQASGTAGNGNPNGNFGGGGNIQVDYQINQAPVRVLDVQMDPAQSKPAVSGVTLEIPADMGTAIDFFSSFGKLHLAQVSPDTKVSDPVISNKSVAKALHLDQ